MNTQEQLIAHWVAELAAGVVNPTRGFIVKLCGTAQAFGLDVNTVTKATLRALAPVMTTVVVRGGSAPLDEGLDATWFEISQKAQHIFRENVFRRGWPPDA